MKLISSFSTTLISIIMLLLLQACDSSSDGGSGIALTVGNITEAEIKDLILEVSEQEYTINFDSSGDATIGYFHGAEGDIPEVVKVKSITITEGAAVVTVSGASLPVINKEITIVVTAKDGFTEKTFTITFVELPKSAEADIKALVIDVEGNEKTVTFDASGDSLAGYSFSGPTPSVVTVKDITVSRAATVTAAKGATIDVSTDSSGGKKVTITVTAQDGETQKIYTIRLVNNDAEIDSLNVTVERGIDKSNDITFDNSGYSTNKVEYEYGPSPGLSPGPSPSKVTVNSIQLSPNASANVVASGEVNVINDAAIITVTAQDGTKETYTIKLDRAKNIEARITRLVITDLNTRDQTGIDHHLVDFQVSSSNSVPDYSATVKYAMGTVAPSKVTVSSIVFSDGAVIKATSDGNKPVLSAGGSFNIYNNKLALLVIAQDDIYTKTYEINFEEETATTNSSVPTNSITEVAQLLAPTLEDILTSGLSTVPTASDLATYDGFTQAVLAPYPPKASLITKYITVSGGSVLQNGSSWSNALAANQLQQTLDNISDASDDKVYLILIASGTYTDNSYDNRDTPLKLKNNVAIIGGWDAKGGWGRNGNTVLNGNNSHQVFNNSYTDAEPLDGTSLLYGITIAAGSNIDGQGGGIYNRYASPSLINVTFSGNSATNGGGIYNTDNSSPTLINVTFYDNSATSSGGAIYNSTNSSPTIINTTFFGNRSSNSGGGAIYSFNSSPIIINSILWRNLPQQVAADSSSITTLAYSVIQKESDSVVLSDENTITASLTTTDPLLDVSINSDSAVAAIAIDRLSSAIDKGIYIRSSGSNFYYSLDDENWYTGFDSNGLIEPAKLPSSSVDQTDIDTTATTRRHRPDAGAYEAR